MPSQSTPALSVQQVRSDERWRPVVGWEGLYSVSDHGRVRKDSSTGTYRAGRIMKPSPGQYGHLRVGLTRGGRQFRYGVHVLVLTAFRGPAPPGHMGRHFPDRDPANNRLDNLHWGTAKENQNDRVFHGTHVRGERQWRAKLTAAAVAKIRALLAGRKHTQREIGQMFGVCNVAISLIKRGKNWKHVR
jgi:hypothetical protein